MLFTIIMFFVWVFAVEITTDLYIEWSEDRLRRLIKESQKK
jgi:hypothetical protein